MLVQFIDVPEAHTFGPTEADADGTRALACLTAALGSYTSLPRSDPSYLFAPPGLPARSAEPGMESHGPMDQLKHWLTVG